MTWSDTPAHVTSQLTRFSLRRLGEDRTSYLEFRGRTSGKEWRTERQPAREADLSEKRCLVELAIRMAVYGNMQETDLLYQICLREHAGTSLRRNQTRMHLIGQSAPAIDCAE